MILPASISLELDMFVFVGDIFKAMLRHRLKGWNKRNVSMPNLQEQPRDWLSLQLVSWQSPVSAYCPCPKVASAEERCL